MRGYSLLELLVVLAILALVAIAAGTTLGGFPKRSNLNDKAANIARLLQTTQITARMEARLIRIAPTADGKGLLINGVAEAQPDIVVRMPRPIVMDAEGFSSGGEIELKDADRASVQLDVEPLTGTVRLKAMP